LFLICGECVEDLHPLVVLNAKYYHTQTFQNFSYFILYALLTFSSGFLIFRYVTRRLRITSVRWCWKQSLLKQGSRTWSLSRQRTRSWFCPN